ncbi:hypothetical protein BV22DRAFT_1124029 [Leucogyrophana mollusca]|uniref:Uncharacterized protein n=1 Tax=Leucogyrophana mollusca TaxID=85980 RepID=A0ACB8AVY7_9AGAM|nr:hypothetical protein BV22DRAFT_1124029 [Leucogyrophana mollusca]
MLEQRDVGNMTLLMVDPDFTVEGQRLQPDEVGWHVSQLPKLTSCAPRQHRPSVIPEAKGGRGRERIISISSKCQMPAGVHHDPTSRRPRVKGSSIRDDTGYSTRSVVT